MHKLTWRNGRRFRVLHYREDRETIVVVKEYGETPELEWGSEVWRFHIEDDESGIAYPVTTYNEAGGGVDYSGQCVSEDSDVWEYVEEELGREIKYLNAQ